MWITMSYLINSEYNCAELVHSAPQKSMRENRQGLCRSRLCLAAQLPMEQVKVLLQFSISWPFSRQSVHAFAAFTISVRRWTGSDWNTLHLHTGWWHSWWIRHVLVCSDSGDIVDKTWLHSVRISDSSYSSRHLQSFKKGIRSFERLSISFDASLIHSSRISMDIARSMADNTVEFIISSKALTESKS